MRPFYFGTRERRLFGVYHPPSGPRIRGRGVVICPPVFLEMMRAHRALRNLAAELARSGCHVLRFDYHGTGDSGGDGSSESVQGWIGDSETAVEELRDLTGVDDVAVVGVRLGGILAAEAAAARPDVRDLVLWDPVLAGERYLEWVRSRVGSPDLRRRNGTPTGVRSWPPSDGEGPIGIDGFPASATLLREIGSCTWGDPALARWRSGRVTVVTSRPAHPDLLLGALMIEGASYRMVSLPDEAAWEDPARQGTTIVAPHAVREIVGVLAPATEGSHYA